MRLLSLLPATGIVLLGACMSRGLTTSAEDLRITLEPELRKAAQDLATDMAGPGREYEGIPALAFETSESRFDESGQFMVRCRITAVETVMTYEAETVEELIVGVEDPSGVGGWVRFRVTSAVRTAEPVAMEGVGYPQRYGGRRGGYGLPVPQVGSRLDSPTQADYKTAADRARASCLQAKREISVRHCRVRFVLEKDTRTWHAKHWQWVDE